MRRSVLAAVTLGAGFLVSSTAAQLPRFDGLVQVRSAHGRPVRFMLTVLALADTRIALRDPEGHQAVMRGFEASCDIPDCDVSADPTVASGDCMLAVGKGSTMAVLKPQEGAWTLELVRRLGKQCSYATRIRLEAGRSSDDLPALSGALMLGVSDSASWKIQIRPEGIRVESESGNLSR